MDRKVGEKGEEIKARREERNGGKEGWRKEGRRN